MCRNVYCLWRKKLVPTIINAIQKSFSTFKTARAKICGRSLRSGFIKCTTIIIRNWWNMRPTYRPANWKYALLKLNMSSKEISAITRQQQSIEVARTRIRKNESHQPGCQFGLFPGLSCKLFLNAAFFPPLVAPLLLFCFHFSHDWLLWMLSVLTSVFYALEVVLK